MATPNEKIIRKAARAFDKGRRFEQPGKRLFLLKRAGATGFSIVREITSGYWVRDSVFRERLVIEIATIDPTFQDDAAQSSFFGYGVPTDDRKIDLYEIPNPSRDKTPPDNEHYSWRFAGLRVVDERFTIPL